MEIEWRDVVGYAGLYLVSNTGQIKSLSRYKRSVDRVLRQVTHSKGYKGVTLYKDGTKSTRTVHRIVAAAFLSPLEGKNQVNHIDGDKANNRVDNLEWATQSENMCHADRFKLRDILGEKHGRSVITNKEAYQIHVLYKGGGITQHALAAQFGVSRGVISNIALGLAWSKTIEQFEGTN